jgi:lipopolysaccharide export LptBFGC system permease protein LptF
MNPRTIASGLLLFTGVAHVAEYFLRSHAAPMLVFGAIYFALGLWLRRVGKPPLIASVVLPGLGGLGGTQQLLTAGAIDPILAGMVAIDAVVVAVCVWCLVKGENAGASSA